MPVFRLLHKTRLSISSRLLRDVFPRLNSSNISIFPANQTTISHSSHFSKAHFSSSSYARVATDLLAEVEREKQKEREARMRAGLDTKDIDQEDEEDIMGVTPLIEKLEKEKSKTDTTGDLHNNEEPSDSDSDDDDDEPFARDVRRKKKEVFDKKVKRHQDLLKNFTNAETLDEALKWIDRIEKFEQKHFSLRPEYRVIGEMINRLKVAEDKEKFILQQKLNRAMRLVDWKEAFDPNNPDNYGLITQEQLAASDYDKKKKKEASDDHIANAGFERERAMMRGDDEEEEFDDMKERDNILLEKLYEIDKKLEEKLAELDHTFGRKGKALEEEIRDLAEERNELTAKKRRPLFRKGFDVKLIGVKKTCKVTKGGQVAKFEAMLACGNYHGVVGFARAKGPKVPVALNKAYEKCFQNLHYVERHEEHTIAHAVNANFKKTKVYLWPAGTTTGMKAGKTVQTILHLAGFKNIKSKVIGSRNTHNTVKALFQALNAVETPKDIQEKFGRTVVEKYLL